MKAYGFMKATEISRKQIGVIYSLAKQGKLSVEKWFMSNLYELADFYNYDYNGTAERKEAEVKKILDNVFSGNIEEAQRLISEMQEDVFSRLSNKNQKNACRAIVC